MNFKKILLSIGTASAIAAPVVAVISCGEPASSQYSEADMLRMSNFKSSEAHSKLQDLWLAKVLKNIYKLDGANSTNLDILKNLNNTTSTTIPGEVAGISKFEEDFKKTLVWVLKNKLFASNGALSSIYQSLKSNAPESVIKTDDKSDERDAVKALNGKVFDRTQINKKVDAIFKGNDWKNIFYNYAETPKDGITFNPSILGVKDLILKMMVTKSYLSLSSSQFDKALPDEQTKVASKFKDSNLINPEAPLYPLVVSVMNSRLAYKTSIELDASKSKEFIISNIDNNLADQTAIDNVFNFKDGGTDNSIFANKLTYSIKHQTRVDTILAKIPDFKQDGDNTIGFQGLSTLPTGEDNLDTNTVSSIKLVKDDSNARDGFIVDSKLVSDDIRYTDEDKTKVELNYYTSLMPVYSTEAKTLTFMEKVKNGTKLVDAQMSDSNIDLLMDEAYSKDSSLFASATKYFTQKTSPVKIIVENDWARNYYIDEGLTYIDDEK